LDENECDPDSWDDLAKRVVEAFRKAAQDSAPDLARGGGPYLDLDMERGGHLKGLLDDMMRAAELRKDAANAALVEHEEEDEEVSTPPRRLPKWAKKLAARAIVLGVNYLQGWLAWQGIKRAALERERNMPKFPLF
jgi:hypothetical protein